MSAVQSARTITEKVMVKVLMAASSTDSPTRRNAPCVFASIVTQVSRNPLRLVAYGNVANPDPRRTTSRLTKFFIHVTQRMQFGPA
jgi:hypothetical protein